MRCRRMPIHAKFTDGYGTGLPETRRELQDSCRAKRADYQGRIRSTLAYQRASIQRASIERCREIRRRFGEFLDLRQETKSQTTFSECVRFESQF